MNHLKLAHILWNQVLNSEDLAVDATCGNGHDTAALAQLTDRVLACDIQDKALIATRERVPTAKVVSLCHSQLPTYLKKQPKLVVYNLGYLPGADKSLTTEVETTLASVRGVLPLLAPKGAISITCYPGHEEGAREEDALIEWVAQLPASKYRCGHYRSLNGERAPSLLFISAMM